MVLGRVAVFCRTTSDYLSRTISLSLAYLAVLRRLAAGDGLPVLAFVAGTDPHGTGSFHAISSALRKIASIISPAQGTCGAGFLAQNWRVMRS